MERYFHEKGVCLIYLVANPKQITSVQEAKILNDYLIKL